MADDMNQSTSHRASVHLGERVYQGLNWTRKDEILLNGRKIGVISLSRKDRAGTTTSVLTGRRERGRKIDWCVNEALLAANASSKQQAA